MSTPAVKTYPAYRHSIAKSTLSRSSTPMGSHLIAFGWTGKSETDVP